MFSDVLDNYVDGDFLDALVTLLPAVGVGVAIGLLVMIIGWILGFVWRAGQDKL